MSDELEEDLEAAYDPVGSMLEDLSEEQKQEIVDEVGERVVEGLKEKNQETFLRDLEGAVIGNLPILKRSRLAQTGIRHAVREIFDERTEDMIQDAGDVVVERLVEYHSDEIVEDVMRTTVRKLQNGD